MVQEGMQLDAPFGAAKGSPGIEGKAEAHYRGVQTEELVFELKFVLRVRGWQRRYIKLNSASAICR